MNRIVLAIASTLIGIIALPGIASAEMVVQNLNGTTCDSFTVDIDGVPTTFEGCATIDAIQKDGTKHNGDVTHAFNGTLVSTLSINGVLQESQTVSRDIFLRIRLTADDEFVYYSLKQTLILTENGLLCTGYNEIRLVNFVLRVEISSFTCE